mmetsp:Transcript_4198/g.15481  ORF Transcript_4198/g.15481 Transcript_4198/m.15481 type:complete len:734 (-) Transcript_4198:217-2418(-)
MGGNAPSTLRWLAGVAPDARGVTTRAALVAFLARLPRYVVMVLALALVGRQVERRFFRGSLFRSVIAWVYGLRAHSHGVRKVDTVMVPTRDGEELATTVMMPTSIDAGKPAAAPLPSVVIRTPYNRFFAAFFAERFAERGYVVVLQDTRGRFESSGTFESLYYEARDGTDTLRWIAQQPWSGGPDDARVAMWGISYLAYAQYAAVAGLEAAHASAPGGRDPGLPRLTAIVPIFGASSCFRTVFGDDTYSLEMMTRWLHLTHFIGGEGMAHPRARARATPLQVAYVATLYRFAQESAVARSNMKPSLTDMHEEAFGRRELLVPMNADRSSKFWQDRDVCSTVHRSPPAHVMSGWHDIFLRCTLHDFERLQHARSTSADGDELAAEPADLGRKHHSRAYLTIGPWHHFESLHMHVFPHLLRESFDFLDWHMRGREAPNRKPVRLFVMDGCVSEGEWREFDAWPPPSKHARMFLHPGGVLSRRAPPGGGAGRDAASAPSAVTYDPHDPTPSVGGTRFHARDPACVDHRGLEARPDVLTFTTAPFEEDVEVIGRVRLDLYLRFVGGTSADYVGRLLDVHPDGRSMNVCEGIVRVSGGAGVDAVGGVDGRGEAVRRVEVDMWATAARFRRGHRMRLHVCCGAHPRWQRNCGSLSGDKDHDTELLLGPSDNIELRSTTSFIFHDDARPSALLLPLAGTSMVSRGSVASDLNLAARGHKMQDAVGAFMTRVGSISDFTVA